MWSHWRPSRVRHSDIDTAPVTDNRRVLTKGAGALADGSVVTATVEESAWVIHITDQDGPRSIGNRIASAWPQQAVVSEVALEVVCGAGEEHEKQRSDTHTVTYVNNSLHC